MVTTLPPDDDNVDVMPEARSTQDEPVDISRQVTVGLATYGNSVASGINVSHGARKNALTITLNRTIRVPDNSDINSLPPSLGQFPLFRVRDYAHNMPEDMAKKGGVFFPMYQREAMWVNFSAQVPFALKLYVGGVNAVSGFPMVENEKTREKRLKMLNSGKQIQDYMVVPGQSWLDGVVSEDGKIRQFVAKPKGSGFSVEAQVTGEEKVGGIQVEIIPIKKNLPTELDVRYEDKQQRVITRTLKLAERGITADNTWLDVKKVIRDEFDIAIKEQSLSRYPPTGATNPFNPNLNAVSIDFSDNIKLGDVYFPAKFSTIGVQHVVQYTPPVYNPQLEYAVASKSLISGPAFALGKAQDSEEGEGGDDCSFGLFDDMPNLPVSQSLGPQMTGYSAAFGAGGSVNQMATFDNPSFGNPSSAIDSFDFDSFSMAPPPPPAPAPMMAKMAAPGSAMDSRSNSSAGPAEPMLAQKSKPRKKEAAGPPKVKEMGLAAGGFIQQTIEPDSNPADVWDIAASVMMNLQILDVESFCAVTGQPSPSTPIDSKAYASYGYPFFEIWGEEKTGIKGEFGEVKSVAQIEAERARARGEEVKEEESVPMRVVKLGMGAFRSTFRPVELLQQELRDLTI